MLGIIENTINWDSIGNYNRDSYKCTAESAFLNPESECFEMSLKLNFIVPFIDSERIKGLIRSAVPELKGVKISYKYEDLILSEEDTIRLAIGHAIDEISAQYSSFTRTIRPSKFEIDGDFVYLYTLGEVIAKKLNKEVSPIFSDILKRNFNIDKKICFKNDKDAAERLLMEKEDFVKNELMEAETRVREAMADPNKGKKKESTAEKGNRQGGKPQGGYGGKESNASGGGAAASGGWRPKRDKYQPIEGNLIMGKAIGDDANFTELKSVNAESGLVTLRGVVFAKGSKPIKNGKVIGSLSITDRKTSVGIKFFCIPEKWKDVDDNISAGDFIKVRGEAQFDTFEDAVTVMVTDIEKGDRPPERSDKCEHKRVELHAHSKMSAMDGINDVENLVKTAARWGQPAVAITDHGVVQAFPDAASQAGKEAEKGRPIKILYGMEGYLIDDEGLWDENGNLDYKKPRSYHIILLAKTQEGLKNIYRLVSYSHLDYFYKKPRLPRSVINANREGIILGSACSAGELYEAILNNESEEKIKKIASWYDYLEIQPLINNRFLTEDVVTSKGEHIPRKVEDQEGLRNINRRIVALADELGKPVVATTDSHYAEPEDAIYRNILMAGMGYKDAEDGEGLYMRTTDEMLEEFSYLGEETAFRVVVENTNKIADMIDGSILPVPKEKYPPKIEGAVETLKNSCYARAKSIYGDPLPEFIQTRLDKEVNSVCDNGYAVMYVSAQMLVKKSNDDGYLVGSRGSVGSSFAATMAGITEVNPLPVHYICPKCKKLIWGDDIYGKGEYDCGNDMPPMDCPDCGTFMKRDGFTIPFETFLGFEGDKEPDIDLNFAGEYQSVAHRYVGEIFGQKNVFKAGTVATVAEKTAYGYVMKYHEERGIPVNKFEVDRLAKGCTGVKRTTGQHPGGMVICPDDHEIYEFCPVQHPANDTTTDIVTTHFDYHKIDANLLKLDILGHDVPSMIRQLQVLTGIDPQETDLSDKDVLKLFNGIESLAIEDPDYQFVHGSYAIPEFGTSFVRKMLDDTKPDKFADLVRLSGFSHGTGVWLGNAQEFIVSGQATMKEVISTRDDIMNYLILKGLPNGTAFKIMENVRKGKVAKGKCKQWDEWKALMIENNVPDWYIESCQRIEYMFPRAHAVAYVMMSFRLAWFKVHFPAAFYAVYFTTKCADFNAEVILRGKDAILKQIDLVAAKGEKATAKEKDEVIVLEVAYEMLARGFKFEIANFKQSDATKFKVVYKEKDVPEKMKEAFNSKEEMFSDGGKNPYFGNDNGNALDCGKNGEEEIGRPRVILPFLALEGMGETASVSMLQAYKERPFETVEEIRLRGGVNKTGIEVLRAYGLLKGLPETDQLSFF